MSVMRKLAFLGLAATSFLATLFLLDSESKSDSSVVSLKLAYERAIERGTHVFYDVPSDQLLIVKPQEPTIVFHPGWPKAEDSLAFGHRVSFSEIPCDFEDQPYVMGWQSVANTNNALLYYCYSLYVIDLKDMKPVKRLLHGKEKVLGDVALSPHSSYVALHVNDADGTNYAIEVFDSQTWNLVARWRVDISSIQFTQDGQHLFATFARDRPGEPPDIVADLCGMEVYKVPSGQMVSSWSTETRQGTCPGFSVVTLPGTKYLVLSDTVLRTKIIVRDLLTGRVIKTIEDGGGRVSEPLSISPDGRWLVARVAADADEVLINQDFKIWDTETWKVVYSSPAYLQLFTARVSVPPTAFQFSPDGKYLLVNKYNHIEIYKLGTGTEHSPRD